MLPFKFGVSGSITARAAVTTTLACLLCAAASAQWINYPTPGIPRLANGKPNLSAPAPKTADGKPDFSGVWEHLNARTTAYYLKGIDIPWQPWAKALFEKNNATNLIDNPESRCLPRGVPKADAFDLHKIVQTPDLMIILYEYQTTYRQIFLDGRELPKDPNPTWAGYSTGHWEGRHAGGGIERLQRPGVAFRIWQSDYGRNAFDRTHAPPRLRAHGHSAHHRRSESLYETVDGRTSSGIDPEYGLDGVRLQ